MSYSNRRYGGRDFRPSPWDSGFSPGRRFEDAGLAAASPLAAANVILNAVLQGNERGLKRRYDYDPRDTYGYDRRAASSSTYRRGTQRWGSFNKGRYSSSSRKFDDKDKANRGKKAKEGEKKEDGDKDEKNEQDEEGATEKFQEWKFRCHLCRKSHESEEEHLEHLETEKHLETMKEQKARYKRQTQAIVHKLRALEDMGQRDGFGRAGFCTVCNVGFYGTANNHNYSRLHKDMRNLKAAFCRYCNMRFMERIKFDQHILTIKHMKLRTKIMKEGGGDIKPEEIDAAEEEAEEDTEDLDYPEKYNGEVALGLQCVRKVIGYFCKICCKFFTEEDRDTHCKNEEHFKNFVEHAKVRKEEIAKKKEEKEQKEAAAAAKSEENGLDETGGDAAMEDVEDEAVDEKELMGDEEKEDVEDEEKEDEDEEKEEEKKEEEVEMEEVEKEESPEPVATPTRGRGRGRGRGRKRSSK